VRSDVVADPGEFTVPKLISGLVLVATLVCMCSAAAGDDKSPQFKIKTKRDTDKVEVEIVKDGTVISVHSPLGIGEAVIERTSDKWPNAVKLRLHLKGLEKFQASAGKATLNAAVSSSDDKVRLWKDGKEDSPLDSNSPLWMEIRILDSDGKPAKEIPLKDGYFEMQFPKSFFEGNPKSIRLAWIDFYR